MSNYSYYTARPKGSIGALVLNQSDDLIDIESFNTKELLEYVIEEKPKIKDVREVFRLIANRIKIKEEEEFEEFINNI